MIDAARFMQDPKNADKVADDGTVTGHNKEVSKAALKEFLAIDFWAAKDDGMDKGKIDCGVGADEEDRRRSMPTRKPVTYDQFVDPSVWKDANAMVK